MVPVASKYKILTAATLSGYLVRNRAGEDLGCVEELMVDWDTGKIAYAVLSFGGFLGFCGKLFAVPWSAFQLDAEQRVLILNVERAALENAPAFQEEEWPDFADQQWGHEIHKYYGLQPYWECA